MRTKPIRRSRTTGLIGLMGLMASVLLLLTACSSSSDSVDVVPEPDNGNPVDQLQRSIGFAGFFADDEGKAASARASRDITRADETPEPGKGEFTNADLQASGFGVYCWYTGTKDYATGSHIKDYTKTILMLNQKVEYKNAQWTYSPTKYWPLNDEEKLTLRAYAPYVSYQLQTDEVTGLPMLPVVVKDDDYHNGTQHDPLWGTSKHDGTTDPTPDPDLDEDKIYGLLYNNYTYQMSGDWLDLPSAHTPADKRNGYIDWHFHHGMSKLMFTCSVLKDPGCDKVIIRSITIENLYTQGLLSLSSPTKDKDDKPKWTKCDGDMTVTLSENDPNTTAGDLAPAPGADEDHKYPFVIETGPQATDPADLLSHGLLIIPRDFTSGEPMKVTITYSIDDDAEKLTATGTIEQDFEGNTAYTLKMNLTPSTKGLEITLVQSAFTPWHDAGTGNHTVYNW